MAKRQFDTDKTALETRISARLKKALDQFASRETLIDDMESDGKEGFTKPPYK